MKRNADNHLNDSKALIVDDDEPGELDVLKYKVTGNQLTSTDLADDLEETLDDDDLLAENNWSDLEDQQVSPASVSEQDVEADDDLATDDGNPDTDSDESMEE